MTTAEVHRREAWSAVGIQIPTTGRCRLRRKGRITKPKDRFHCKIGFPCNELPFNEIEFLQFHVFLFTFQKADGNASGFYKYPRADGIQTKSNPHKSRVTLPPWTELLNPSIIRKPSSTNPSKNSPSTQNSNQNPQQRNPKSRIWTMADSAAQSTNSAIDDAAIYGLKVIFGLIL